jgi:class 3 adenylate cyclase
VSASAFPPPDHIDALTRAWHAHDPEEWKREPARFHEFGRRAIELGAPALAYDMLSEALLHWPRDPVSRYLAALALANGGSSGQAAKLLRELLADGRAGPLMADVLSLAGRVAKDRWSKLANGPERAAAGEQARRHYWKAFEVSRAPFPGINAATMSFLTGQRDDGRRIAGQVRDLSNSDLAAGHGGDPWRWASLGEAQLLLGEETAAADCYRNAAAAARGRHGDIASMRRQLRLLQAEVEAAGEILSLLVMPRVAMFSGHMIDAPSRESPRFPAWIEQAVATAISKAVAEHRIGIGYCSAACGADILFAESMLSVGAEINVVLPFHRDDFIRTSVAFAGVHWVRRFEAVMARAASVTYCVDENHLGDDVLFSHASDLTAGYALLRAAQLESEAVMVALAELGDEGGVGGTASNVGRWVAAGRAAEILDLSRIRQSAARPPAAAPDAFAAHDVHQVPDGLPWGRRQIRTMLFADVVGYIRLQEYQTPRFFGQFLEVLDREMRVAGDRPVFGNTWGDGLYLVFEEAPQGAGFALRLRDAFARIDWGGLGLPADMALRIGMHTGPVFRAADPIIRRENYFGSHVTRAARIEPVAASGSVYVSEQMAASLAACGEGRFACDYLGVLGLAKQFGSGRIYRLRRHDEAD